MNIHRKIFAFVTTAAAALSLAACSYPENVGFNGAPQGAEQTSDGVSASYLASLENLLNKYENDFLNDLKKNGLPPEADISSCVTGWAPERLAYGDPEKGGDAVLSSASLDGVDVSLIAHNITHLPDDGADEIHTEDCKGTLCAERILLYLKDGEGRKTLSTQINSISPGHHRISGECLFDGSTRIYKTEQDGMTYYLLMQFAEYNEEKDALIATFYVLDMELYDLAVPRDENGITGGGLWCISISAPEGTGMSLWGQAYQASKRFEYKEGTTFADPEYGYEITFDMRRGRAEVTYPAL
ncbi:MAG: hypothetical protein NC401_14430 [Ruminococcus sp.]|nr:hypothetical protein [Ruminococcus sp.]